MDSQGLKAKLEELKNIMPFWLGMGCDGFRVDMAGSLVKHDKEFPEAAMVSEWGESDKSLQGGFLLHFGPSHYNDLFGCENPFFAAKIVFSNLFLYIEKNYEILGLFSVWRKLY